MYCSKNSNTCYRLATQCLLRRNGKNCQSQENIKTNKCLYILLIALMSVSYRGKSSSKIYFKAKLDCW